MQMTLKLNTTNQMVREFNRVLTMKPETIARRAAKRIADTAARKQSTTERLKALVERDGPDSIWAELLAEQAA
jgi:hypothetical protein